MASMLIALGFWLVGSAILGISQAQANGDIIETSLGTACISQPVYVITSTCSNPGTGCTGSCLGSKRDDTVCTRTTAGSAQQCNTSTGVVFQQNYASGCSGTISGTGRNLKYECICGVGQPVGAPSQTQGNVCGYDV